MALDFERLYEDLLEDEFAEEGSVCAQLYGQAYEMRVRLGERLHTDADDVEIVQLVDSLEAIQKEMCLKMASRASRASK